MQRQYGNRGSDRRGEKQSAGGNTVHVRLDEEKPDPVDANGM
jgi:hypothetical protein